MVRLVARQLCMDAWHVGLSVCLQPTIDRNDPGPCLCGNPADIDRVVEPAQLYLPIFSADDDARSNCIHQSVRLADCPNTWLCRIQNRHELAGIFVGYNIRDWDRSCYHALVHLPGANSDCT